MTLDTLPSLTPEESHFVYLQADDLLSAQSSPRGSFARGFRVAKMWYEEKLNEMGALRDQAQRDKNDATKANVLLVRSEKNQEEMSKTINGLMQDLAEARARNVSLQSQMSDPGSSTNQRLRLYTKMIEHPALKPAFGRGGSLSEGMIERLDELAQTEKAVIETLTEDLRGTPIPNDDPEYGPGWHQLSEETVTREPVQASRAQRTDAELRNLAASWAASSWSPEVDYTSRFDSALNFLKDHKDPENEQALFMSKWNIGLAKEIYRSLTEEDGSLSSGLE